jgi:hypothetical protein
MAWLSWRVLPSMRRMTGNSAVDDPEGPGLVVVVVPSRRLLADPGSVGRTAHVAGPVLVAEEFREQIHLGQDEPLVLDVVTPLSGRRQRGYCDSLSWGWGRLAAGER